MSIILFKKNAKKDVYEAKKFVHLCLREIQYSESVRSHFYLQVDQQPSCEFYAYGKPYIHA